MAQLRPWGNEEQIKLIQLKFNCNSRRSMGLGRNKFAHFNKPAFLLMDIQKANRTAFNYRPSIQLSGFATLSGQSLLYRKFEEFILKWHVKLFLFNYLNKSLLAHVYTGCFHCGPAVVLIICVTKIAKSSLEKALAENGELDVGTSQLPVVASPSDLQQPLVIKIDTSNEDHEK